LHKLEKLDLAILEKTHSKMDKFKLFFEDEFENINTELDEYKTNLSVGVIGAGRLGLALVTAFNRMGKLRWALARSSDSKLNVINKIFNSQIVKSSVDELDVLPKVLIIAVSDDQIELVADSIAMKFGDELNGVYVCHCSGFLNIDLLDSCKKFGALIGGMHPFQTFYYENETVFKNVSWGLECSDENDDFFRLLVESLEGNTVRLTPEAIANKKLYHAIAVAASNYLTPVLQLANSMAKSIDFKADDLIYSIARTTITNNVKSFEKNDFPLTGPIARGDKHTLEMHLASMAGDMNLKRPYCQMGLLTAEMAFTRGILSEDDFFEIMAILKNGML